MVDYLKKVGLEIFADKRIYELSGGMKQRVSIARALINNSEKKWCKDRIEISSVNRDFYSFYFIKKYIDIPSFKGYTLKHTIHIMLIGIKLTGKTRGFK